MATNLMELKNKNGYERTGIEHDDGFNYWLKTDHGREGNAKKFIVRAKDFKRAR